MARSPGRAVTERGQTLVFDCFSGIAGDMTLGALIDAGAPIEAIRAGLAPLGLPPFALRAEPVVRAGMRALKMHVEISEEHTYQPGEMRSMVMEAALPARVKERSLAAIAAMAAGEALAHATSHPRFHEAGGVDAVIDLVGSMLGLEALDVSEAYCPVVTVGAATIVKAEHGALPAAPGPAAAYTLQTARFALRFVEATHELVTPSGAAILAAVAKPSAVTIIPAAHGAGAGTMDPPGRPNAVRVFVGARLGAEADGLETRELVQLEANIDDMPATLLAHARDRLLDEGALDAWLEPIGMKKGRSAAKLCALVPFDAERRFALLFLAETTTLGVRVTAYRRYEAARRIETRETSLGPVRVKVREWGGTLRLAPEYEDVKALAAALRRPAIEVLRQLERELG